MFRTIRNKTKALDLETTKALLKNQRRGIISVQGDDGYPYGIPINYLYCEDEDKIYFHGCPIGHKADSIKKCNKVCFSVCSNEIIKEEKWAPYMQSAILFGRCNMINDRDLSEIIIRKIAEKYYPDTKLIDEEISKSANAVQIYEITIEHLSGKQIQER